LETGKQVPDDGREMRSNGVMTPASLSNSYRWYVVILLAFAYTVYTADKTLLSVLVEPIKREFAASDSRMGLISLLAATCYALCVIPMGLIADRTNRRRMLAVILAGWSLMTALSGFARNTIQLAAAQMLLGLNESGGSPTMSSLIADLFARRRRGLPVAVWYCGISLGAFVGFSLGGYLADKIGWRATFVALGVPGLLIALLVRTTVLETPRGMADGSTASARPAPNFRETIAYLKSQTALRHAVFGQCLSGIAFIGPIYWLVSFFVRVHGTSLAAAGSAIGLIFLVTGLVSAPLGGVIMDRLGHHDVRWHGWICALMMLTGGVAMAGIYLVPTTIAAFAACFLWQLLTNAVSPITVTVISNLAPAQYRALSNALGFLLFQLMGFGLGAQIIGSLSDWLAAQGGYLAQNSLRIACLSMVIFHGWAAIHFWIVARHSHAGYQHAARLESTAD
jgi:predicted MFS family arabinose efflux permease